MSTPDPTDGASLVRLTIPAKAEYITLCRLALSGLSRLRPLPDETIADMKLALTEACSNSIRHAYEDGREGVVEIVYDLRPDRIAIEVADEGAGFEPREGQPGPDGLNESGLGIAIIRSLADEFELGRREDGRGARLRFAKLL